MDNRSSRYDASQLAPRFRGEPVAGRSPMTFARRKELRNKSASYGLTEAERDGLVRRGRVMLDSFRISIQ
jgi:hypothetical protein